MNQHEEIKQGGTSSWPTGEGQEKDDHAGGIGAQKDGARESPKETVAVMVPIPSHPLFINRIGKRYGRLLVIYYAGDGGTSKSQRWVCLCDCGRQKSLFGSALVSGSTVSCGCYRDEAASKRKTTHGASHNAKYPEYRTWVNMRQRCNNPECQLYKDYGGRGVTVCKSWDDFTVFLADMGRMPSPLHTIDRFPNNDGNYEPSNCRWATRKEQANNRRNTRIITHDGLSMSVAQWERHLKQPRGYIQGRLKRGWAMGEIIAGKRAQETGFFSVIRPVSLPRWAAEL